MSVVYFTDRDLGKRFPEILIAGGLTVHRHVDHFAPDCPDEEWLEAVGQNKWVAITHDKRIRYKPNELAAVIAHNVRLLVVVGKAPFPVLAKHFVGRRLETYKRTRVRPAPLCAGIRNVSEAVDVILVVGP